MEQNKSLSSTTHLNIENSLEYFNSKSFEEYKEWLDKSIKLDKFSVIFYFAHMKNFLKRYASSLGYEKFFYLEKLFTFSLELKLVDFAKRILAEINHEFGREPKIRRMEAELAEIDPRGDTINPVEQYKSLMRLNQEDRQSIKRYLLFLKASFKFDEIKSYIELWNEYLKVYMDDCEAWQELGEVYILTNNSNKAIYCLEEILLHYPTNYKIYIKIADIQCSMNNSEGAVFAIKYYCQSILIKPTPRAFWGIVYALNIIYRVQKTLDQKLKNLLKIAKSQLGNYYAKSPFKITVDSFFEIKSE